MSCRSLGSCTGGVGVGEVRRRRFVGMEKAKRAVWLWGLREPRYGFRINHGIPKRYIRTSSRRNGRKEEEEQTERDRTTIRGSLVGYGS